MNVKQLRDVLSQYQPEDDVLFRIVIPIPGGVTVMSPIKTLGEREDEKCIELIGDESKIVIRSKEQEPSMPSRH